MDPKEIHVSNLQNNNDMLLEFKDYKGEDVKWTLQFIKKMACFTLIIRI